MVCPPAAFTKLLTMRIPPMKKNTVLIGRKPVMAYVMAVMTAFKNNPEEVIIKARGRSISIAVDVAEVTRNNYLSDITNHITISTEKLDGDTGPRNVSAIEIVLRKKQK